MALTAVLSTIANVGSSIYSAIGGNKGKSQSERMAEDYPVQLKNLQARINTYASNNELNADQRSYLQTWFDTEAKNALQANPYIFDIGSPEPLYPKGNIDFENTLSKVLDSYKQDSMTASSNPLPALLNQDLSSLISSQVQDLQNTVNGITPNAIGQYINTTSIVIVGGILIAVVFLTKGK